MSVALGSRLGPYEIVARLGAGGMGEVYRARDARLQRDVAVKVLPAAVAGDPERLARLEREARALARLSHPAVLSIFDFGKEGETAYAVTELLEGETLRERLERERLPWRRAAEIAAAVAEGLAAAHGAGIIHRDLKPENIFLTGDGRVKILDFGLAVVDPSRSAGGATLSYETPATTPGSVLGTVGYMAPEQVRGRPADARSDIFSLGCVLYEMLTGRRAFKRDTPAETMTAILKDSVPETVLSGTGISSELDRIVGRCLEKNPAERFQSACDLAFSLRELIEPGGRAGRQAPAGRRLLWIAGGVVLAALLAAAAIVFLGRRGGVADESGAGEPAASARIAVLPFENLGAENEAYFAAGVTDEITGRLASLRGLAVISRACAAQYAGTSKSVREIGDELEAGYLLTGTVRWARGAGTPDRVRITPALVRVADETSLWSEIYEFTMGDIFGVQSEIARSVVSALGLTLLEHESGSLEERPTADMEAYQAFLRGKFLAGQPHFTLATWLSAVEDFERAVALDPGFALAWAELTRAHARLIYYRHDLSPRRFDQARNALSHARGLAPDKAEVRLAAGYYHLWVERDSDSALPEFEKASRLMPNSVEVQEALGELYRLRGDWQRSIDAYQVAGSLSPRDGSVMVDVAETFWFMHRYPEALKAADRAIALSPDQPWPYLAKAFTLWSWKGRDALADTRTALQFVSPDYEWADWSWFWQEAFEGHDAEAVRRMEADADGWFDLKIQAAPKALFAATLNLSFGETTRAKAGFEAALRQLEPKVRDVPDDGRFHSSLGIALAGLGRREEALRYGRRGVELLPVSKDAVYGLSAVIDLAHIYAMLGDVGKAVDELEFLLSRPGWFSPPIIRMDYRWRPLKGDPRFEALLAKHESTRF
ncbi:MAG: protein kinase [Candidatus Aminicenantes bacterium]|nr:protein kinase [Candidatus Aminicenantes bacterium]